MARIPTLAEFAEERFRPFVKATFAAKPKTQVYYENGLNNLLAFDRLADQRIDEITGELVAAYVATRNAVKLEISSIIGNSRFSGACSISPTSGRSWNARLIASGCSKARTSATAFSRPGREAVSRPDGTAAARCGDRLGRLFAASRRVLQAEAGAYTAWKPRDPLGKTANAVRKIPMTPRVDAIIKARDRSRDGSPWLFPAPTASGTSSRRVSRNSMQRLVGWRSSIPSTFTPFGIRV